MSELEFRAFRPKFGDDKIDVMTEPFTMGNLQDKDQFNFTNGTYASWDEFGLENPETIVMQFTGLLDRHKVKIFKGDIVQLYNTVYEKLEVCEVIFLEGAFMLQSNNCAWGIGGLTDPQTSNRIAKVIGNIHENPELLVTS